MHNNFFSMILEIMNSLKILYFEKFMDNIDVVKETTQLKRNLFP